MNEFLTTSEVAQLLRIKERKVYDLASSGTLPCTRAIGKLLFPRTEIEAWLKENRSGSHTTNASSADSQPARIDRPLVIAGSHDPLLDWAIRQSGASIATLFESSRDGIRRFADGGAMAAGVHLPNTSNDGWNTEEVSTALEGHDFALLEFAKRQRGLVIASNKAAQITSVPALAGHRFQPRQATAGSQVFFEKVARENALDLRSVEMLPPVLSERDVVQAVAMGKADAGFALQSLSVEYNLPFIPLATERFDMIVDRRSYFSSPYQTIVMICGSKAFKDKADELTGYDLSGSGTVHFNP